ncbi:MAG: hypothetical protein EOO39_02750 [Cytophagaceae bacterium]|nr:MAG: hypothetical protein EOO39_02750 [Cytophagaceae bacterium]
MAKSSFGQVGNPPPCTEAQQVNVSADETKRKILVDFIQSCGARWWSNDKGLVHLREYRNDKGKLCWLLLPCIDDRHRDNPPNRFADLNGDIILIFDADSRGNLKPITDNQNALNQCLDQIIGDRVYNRPTVKGRWTSDVLPFSNRKRAEGNHWLRGGNGGSLIVIFNEDGTFQKLSPV